MKNLSNSRPRMVENIVLFVERQSRITQILILGGLLLGLIVLFLAVDRVSARFSTVVPTSGGIIREGVVGYPRIINPIYAETNAERDMVALVYSGLMKVSSDGFVPDLAESVNVGEDGQAYTVTLRDDAVFQDGEPITAEDVVFTIEEIQNPTNESPLLADWAGVSAEAIDPQTVRFTLDEPYAFFRENLTVGIVPEHLWRNVSSDTLPFLELGSRPVGSGPFEIAEAERNELGVVDTYTLEPFEQYAGVMQAYIDSLELHFFEDQTELFDSLNSGTIDATALVAPSSLREHIAGERQYNVNESPMPRTFGLFWNQNDNQLFVDRDVRQALTLAVDREALVEEIFSGYAEPLAGPLPSHALEDVGIEAQDLTYDPEQARTLLAENGWEENEEGVLELDDTALAFTITTISIPELVETAEFLERSFEEIGADITIETADIGVLSRDHIRSREYEALLFGLAYNHSFDLAPFFHSSNTEDPGLNIALYTNSSVDNSLETVQEAPDPEIRRTALESALTEIRNDRAALFLYSPKFTYVTTPRIQGMALPPIAEASERFSSVTNWFVNTERIFTIFNR